MTASGTEATWDIDHGNPSRAAGGGGCGDGGRRVRPGSPESDACVGGRDHPLGPRGRRRQSNADEGRPRRGAGGGDHPERPGEERGLVQTTGAVPALAVSCHERSTIGPCSIARRSSSRWAPGRACSRTRCLRSSASGCVTPWRGACASRRRADVRRVQADGHARRSAGGDDRDPPRRSAVRAGGGGARGVPRRRGHFRATGGDLVVAAIADGNEERADLLEPLRDGL